MQHAMMGRPIVRGRAQGRLVVAAQPLSFWGGLDAATGIITDRHHDLFGQCVTGIVLALPGGRGSSTGSAVLLESICRRTAPAAILLGGLDMILAVGAIVADEMFGSVVPVVLLSEADFQSLPRGGWALLHSDGRVDTDSQ